MVCGTHSQKTKYIFHATSYFMQARNGNVRDIFSAQKGDSRTNGVSFSSVDVVTLSGVRVERARVPKSKFLQFPGNSYSFYAYTLLLCILPKTKKAN
jgi:hypothetical protein